MAGTKNRLNKDEWLKKALELINREGPSCLKLRSLTKKLGVTTGSFYWHFESTEDFINEILQFWEQEYSLKVKSLVESIDDEITAKEKLTFVIANFLSNEYSQFEMGMRAWASTNKQVAEVVNRGDKWRESVIKPLFVELGYEGEDLDIRLENCFAYLNFHSSLNVENDKSRFKNSGYFEKLTEFYLC